MPYFHFDDEAQGLFYEWLKAHVHKLHHSPDEPIVIEHLAKYRKLLPSLALIFHLIDVASGESPGPIPITCFERAAGWCEYLERHARRIYEMAPHTSYQAARHLARKIQEGEVKKFFDERTIYRKGWSFLKTKESVEAACEVLIQNGWLREGEISEGGKPQKGYLVNPHISATSLKS